MKKFLALMLCLMMALGCIPALAEESVYTTLYSGEVTSLNYLTTATANEFAVAANVIDTLVEYDRFGQIQPSLALEWQNSEDGLVWTFTLRQDAVWVDANCNTVAPVTANDFVDAAKYVLNAANASSTANILYGVVAGAEDYYTATSTEGAVADWDAVGVKALDDYTLQYTLSNVCPYFLSMTTYVCFMPVNGAFLEQKGDQFGLATGNDTILYCGAYVLSEFKPQETRVLSKNTANWDAANVTIDTIKYVYNKEASTISADLYLKGEVDSASIDNQVASEWLADPAKADYIRPVRQNDFYTYFYAFNFDPQFDAEFEPENWKIAVANENFRQSIYWGLNRISAMMVTDPDNADALVYNTITPPEFVVLDGVDFTEMGDLAAITAMGNDVFDAAKAIEYRDAAIADLTAAGATFPIKILMSYNPGSTGWADECSVVESQLENLLGADYIDIICEAGPSSGFLSAVRRSGKYALLKCNWGPDYADPETYTDPFCDGSTYNFLYKNADMADVTAELYGMVDAAKDITTDMTARYIAFANAEAFMINKALVIPFGFGDGGYTASRLDPYSMQYAPFGISNDRYKGATLLDTAMSTDMYYDAYDAWLDAREALNK